MTVKQLREILEEYEDTAEITLEIEDYCGIDHYGDTDIDVYKTPENQVCIRGIQTF